MDRTLYTVRKGRRFVEVVAPDGHVEMKYGGRGGLVRAEALAGKLNHRLKRDMAALEVEDMILMVRHMVAGRLRWEEFPASISHEGELCFNGIRHFTRLDDDGVPILPGGLRGRLMAWKAVDA